MIVFKYKTQAHTHTQFQDSVARLLNAVASGRKGREYLAAYDIVPLIFFGEQLLGARYEKPRTQLAQTTSANLLGAAFKISLVLKQRIVMVHRNVTQWTINHLIDMENSALLTDYQLKVATSLLLVLLAYKPHLRHGISECLTLLETYLSHTNPECVENVCKILIVLMGNSNIRAYAKGMGLAMAITNRQMVSGSDNVYK